MSLRTNVASFKKHSGGLEVHSMNLSAKKLHGWVTFAVCFSYPDERVTVTTVVFKVPL